MFLSWFKTHHAVAFANDLAAEFRRRISPEELANPTPQTESRLRGAKDLLLSRAQVFAERTPLNILSRAKIANTFKWQLIEQGYNPTLIEPIVIEVVRTVTITKMFVRKK
jgi:hypothetical protein